MNRLISEITRTAKFTISIPIQNNLYKDIDFDIYKNISRITIRNFGAFVIISRGISLVMQHYICVNKPIIIYLHNYSKILEIPLDHVATLKENGTFDILYINPNHIKLK